MSGSDMKLIREKQLGLEGRLLRYALSDERLVSSSWC